MSMRLAVYVSMGIFTYEKVSLYRAGEHKIYVHASSYAKVSLYRLSEHKIYVYAFSYVCVFVHLHLWKGEFVPNKWT